MNTASIQNSHPPLTLGAFMTHLIDEMNRAERYATSRNYRRTRDSFMKYRCGRALDLDALTAEEVGGYNRFLRESGLQRNTISFYNRILRAAYNQAVKRGLAQQTDPFREVYTGVDVTRKRALSAAMLRRLAGLELADPETALSRDLFLFSFQTRGMSFVDMAFLTHKNLQAGFICYVRRKTGQALSVRMEPWIQQLLDRYSPVCYGPYLLPILHTCDTREAFAEYQAALGRHDRQLRKIGAAIGVPFSLSSYSARHSWATLARDAAVPLSVISSGMGHTSEKTTRIYLASLDNSLIDRANKQVWEQIFTRPPKEYAKKRKNFG